MSTNNQSSMAQRIISTTASSNLLNIDSLNSKNCGKQCVDSNSFSGFKHPDCNTFELSNNIKDYVYTEWKTI